MRRRNPDEKRVKLVVLDAARTDGLERDYARGERGRGFDTSVANFTAHGHHGGTDHDHGHDTSRARRQPARPGAEAARDVRDVPLSPRYYTWPRRAAFPVPPAPLHLSLSSSSSSSTTTFNHLRLSSSAASSTSRFLRSRRSARTLTRRDLSALHQLRSQGSSRSASTAQLDGVYVDGRRRQRAPSVCQDGGRPCRAAAVRRNAPAPPPAGQSRAPTADTRLPLVTSSLLTANRDFEDEIETKTTARSRLESTTTLDRSATRIFLSLPEGYFGYGIKFLSDL
ncbi:uncharacterized protein LOC118646655 [Monomorium pharaonis]|uniref:uncharacterized protein LOC118646655 n=1 Tax=Monomorium pharaonis TaxID=307658 RepID=UPI001745DD3D|nr:uncharacterized protein LOC118646655 [Monomorium pharaonis]